MCKKESRNYAKNFNYNTSDISKAIVHFTALLDSCYGEGNYHIYSVELILFELEALYPLERL